MTNARASIRVVLDTNIFVSAIVFGGKPRRIIDSVALNTISLVMAEEMVTEMRRIVVDKFPDFLRDLHKVEKLIESDAIWVKLGLVGVSASRDPDDDKFIEAALMGEAQYIVSGDKDLLDLRNYEGVQIMSPAEFLRRFG